MKTKRSIRYFQAFPVILMFAAWLVLRVETVWIGDHAVGSMQPASAKQLAFKHAVNTPRPNWKGHVFEPSHDFPTESPRGDPRKTYKWLQRGIEFKNKRPRWNEDYERYIMDVLDYIREGQDAQLGDRNGFQAKVNGKPRWFHMPWMSVDAVVGREFVHGLTNERTAILSDFLGDDQKGRSVLPLKDSKVTEGKYQTWSVGFYNYWGGYAIGQAWNQDGTPSTVVVDSQTRVKGLPFPEGTVVAKLLFTTATPKDVYYLRNSPEWTANRHVQLDASKFDTGKRKPQAVRLVQIDIAVVDSRSPSRWVFGTFAYNGTIDKNSIWDRLSPVGLQWGSDPMTFPAVPKGESQAPRESVLAKLNIYEHYGSHGRLAGPVDSKVSSCMSCHGGAYAAPVGTAGVQGKTIPSIFAFKDMGVKHTKENANYFRNYPFPEPYPNYPKAIHLDTSLQLQVAFTQYGLFQGKRKK